MRLVKYREGKYWYILKTVSLKADGRTYHREEFIIGLRGSIPKEEAMALLRDLEEGKAEVRKDRFGHKYVYEFMSVSNTHNNP